MARRGGKAASRRSRQRRAQRAQPQQQQQQTQQTRPMASEPAAPAELSAAAAAGPVDAFERADAELRASTPPPGTRATATPKRSVRARTSDFTMATGSSRLTERAAAEYHYVGRDLRNIAILLLVMVVLLAASAVAVNVLGIGAQA